MIPPLFLCIICCLFSLIHSPVAADQELVRFDSVTARDLLRNWPTTGGQSHPKLTEHGPLFALNFAQPDKRVVYDCQGKWNLSRESCIRFELDAQRPEEILEASLYLRSGTGWYAFLFTLNGLGSHTITIPLSDFGHEGTPTGWHDISTIRFAFWPRNTGMALVRPIRLHAIAAPVLIVNGAADSPQSQRYLCKVTAKRMREIMRHTGIPFGVTGTDALRQALSSTRPATVILPYLPSPSQDVLEALNQHRLRGGRFIVFQSESPTLAKWMEVKVGASLSSESVGKFDHLQFSTSEFGFPRKIYQHAWSFRSVTGIGSTKTLAKWVSHDGRGYPLSGVLHSKKGYWLSHVWRSADLPGKAQAMTAMLGSLDTNCWQWASDALYKRVNPRAFQVKYGNISPTHKPSRNMRQVADQIYAKAIWAQNAGRYKESWEQFSRVEPLMFRALASGYQRWMPPLRGIWDQNGTGFAVGKWDETCRQLKHAGFNAVFNYVGSPGRANYPSRFIPGSKTLSQHGDQVRQSINAARKYGLESHLWRISWKTNATNADFDEQMGKAGRLMQDPAGNNLPWLSPSDPRNVRYEIDSMLELLRNYRPNGLHLDYMRYPGPEADYGPAARKSFEARYGKVTNWPSDVVRGSRKNQYLHFKQEELHRAMQQIHRAVKAEFPNVVLSVAVWGAYPDCSISKAQDWPVWLKQGYADLLIPMNYTTNPYQLNDWIANQLLQPGCKGRILPGLGIISNEAELDPAQLLQQLEICRNFQVPGVVLYRSDSSLSDRLFPMLQAGIWE